MLQLLRLAIAKQQNDIYTGTEISPELVGRCVRDFFFIVVADDADDVTRAPRHRRCSAAGLTQILGRLS